MLIKHVELPPGAPHAHLLLATSAHMPPIRLAPWGASHPISIHSPSLKIAGNRFCRLFPIMRRDRTKQEQQWAGTERKNDRSCKYMHSQGKKHSNLWATVMLSAASSLWNARQAQAIFIYGFSCKTQRGATKTHHDIYFTSNAKLHAKRRKKQTNQNIKAIPSEQTKTCPEQPVLTSYSPICKLLHQIVAAYLKHQSLQIQVYS